MVDHRKVISMVLDVFPLVTEAAEKYKITEPDRESRGLARGIAIERTLFKQSVQKLLFFSHSSSNHESAWLQRLDGPETAERVLHDLQAMHEQLDTFKAEILNAGRGKEVLDKIRGRAPGTSRGRDKIPRTRLQKRLDLLSKMNQLLASRFVDRQTLLSCTAEMLSMRSIVEFLTSNAQRLIDIFNLLCEGYRCSCEGLHIAYLRCPEISLGAVPTELTSADAKLPLEIIMQPKRGIGGQDFSTDGPLSRGTEDSGSTDGSGTGSSAIPTPPPSSSGSVTGGFAEFPGTVLVSALVRAIGLEKMDVYPVQDICSMSAAAAARSDKGGEITGRLDMDAKKYFIAFSKLKDTKSIIPLQDWMQRQGSELDPKRRLELALQLSFAVIQLSSTPWIDDSWNWNSWAIVDDQSLHDRSRTLVFRRQFYSSSAPFGTNMPPSKLFSILSREPILAKLGLCLIELAFGQFLAELRRKSAEEEDLEYEMDSDYDADSLGFFTAKQLLASRKIRDEVGQSYEDAVKACIHQQVRTPKTGEVIELDRNNDSFVMHATSSIILPLQLQMVKYLRPGHRDTVLNKALAQGLSARKDDPEPVGGQGPIQPSRPSVQARDMDESRTDEPGSVETQASVAGLNHSYRADVRTRIQLRNNKEKQAMMSSPDDTAQKSRHDDLHYRRSTQESTPTVVRDLPHRTPTEAKPATENAPALFLHENRRHDEVRQQDQSRGQNLGFATNQSRPSPRPSSPSLRSRDDSEPTHDSLTETTTDSTNAWASNPLDDPPEVLDDVLLLGIKDIVLRIVLQSFFGWRDRSPGTHGNIGSTAPRDHRQSKKRPGTLDTPDRGDGLDDDDGDDDDAPMIGDSTTRKRQRGEDNKLTLACPFFKKDPRLHQVCCGRKLTRIRDVKQHLKRRHVMPIYCAICNVTFVDEEARDAHTRQRNCVEGNNQRPQGITLRQQSELTGRVSRKLSIEGQWYSIFDILFPGEDQPQSPYIDTSLFESSMAYHEFLTSQGPIILHRVLSAANAWPDTGDAGIRVFQNRILRDGLVAIFEEWARHGGATASSRPPSNEGESMSVNMVNTQTSNSATIMDDAASASSALPAGTLSSIADSSDYLPSHSDQWGWSYDLPQQDYPDFSGMEIIGEEDVMEIQRIVSNIPGSHGASDWQGGPHGNHFLG